MNFYAHVGNNPPNADIDGRGVEFGKSPTGEPFPGTASASRVVSTTPMSGSLESAQTACSVEAERLI